MAKKTTKTKATPEPRVIYYQWFTEAEIGECQGFFEIVKDELVLIGCWSCNDGEYRHEYMGGVFTYLGVDVQRLPDEWHAQAVEKLKKTWGF
jgi:hypothetical protein